MAKLMSYVDPNTDAVYSQSVWFPVGVYCDFSTPTVNIVWNGYSSLQHAQSILAFAFGNSDAVKKNCIGQKSYILTQEEFIQFAANLGNNSQTLLDHIAAVAYQIAESRLDTLNDEEEMVSFFATASDISLT